MKRHKSPIALLASCMLLTNGIRTDIPFSRCEPAETKTLSEFAAQLTQASDAAPHRELFCTLRFSGAEQQLYRDGEPVGRSYAGCRIENGGLVISTDGQNALTPQEAAEQIGCRVLEQDGDLTVTFPFQTAKLIVKAEQEPALHGGRLLASGFQDLYVVQFESQEAAYRAYQAYQQDPDVEFADCDSVLSAAEMHGSGTNALDSERTSWGVHDIGADDYCAWLTETKETLPEVCVAVVDTGVNAAHSWLNGRILPNGARFSEDAPGGWEDDFGHGTHCAGIIASCTMDNVKILPIKVLNREGMGTTLEIYCGVMYALEQGADVISMSLGGLGVSPLLNAAAAAASEQDVTFCVAAGNDSLDTKYDNVATAPDVIAVAALGSDHWCAGFSNRGAEIDFAAPGVKILSAISESTDATMLADGTSMATPFVAAAASDLLSYDPELSAEQIYEYLRANAKDLGDPGFDPYYGWGEVSLRDFRFSEKSCPAPVFSPKGGEYRNAQEITLECEADGKEPAAIYYTLDGSEPDPEHALLYTGEPVLLEHSATVKAAAVSGGVQSRTVSEAYCIGDTDTADALDIQDGVLAGYHGTRCRLYLDELVEDGSLKAIGAGAFAGNDSLIEVILPDSVTEIGERAFYECGSLENVTGAGVRKIGTEAFCNCGKLDKLDSDALDAIGTGAFRNCHSLLTLKGGFSDACTEIPAFAFSGCSMFYLEKQLHVTKVGAYAFSGIGADGSSLNQEALSWEKLESVGPHAFESAGVAGTLHLDALKSIGEYAFFGNRIRELRLPDSITALPEGVLRESSVLRVLTAKGVTKVGAGALQRTEPQQMLAELDFENMTEIGRCAFDGVSFVRPVTFPKLTAIEKSAIDGIAGPCFSFPAVQTLQTDAIRRAEHAKLLCFENLVSAEFEAVQNVHAVVVGDSFRTAASGSIQAEVLAGPDNSPLKDYAARLSVRYLKTPSPVTDETELYTDTLTTAELHAYPAGFGDLHVKWFDADGNLMKDDGSGVYYVYSEQAGTFRYRAVLYDGSEEAGAEDFTVHVTDAAECTPIPVKAEDLTYIDWEDALENGTAVRTGFDELMALVRFQPEEDGVYSLLKSGGRSALRLSFPDGTELFDQVMPMETVRVPFYAAKGYTYLIRVFATAEMASNAKFDTVRIIRGSAASIRPLTEISVKAEWPDMPEGGLPATGKPLEPDFASVIYTADGTVLRKGTDYTVRYRCNTDPGTAAAWIVGIGDYCGSIQREFSVCGVIRDDQRVRVGLSDIMEETYYTFTPEENGTYSIYLDYSDEWIEKQTEYSCFCSGAWSQMRDLSVHELTPDGRCIRVADADSQTSGMLPGVTLELKKGAVYLLTFWDYTETDEELELCVRHHAELIGNYLPDLPEEQEHIRLFAGEAVPSLAWTQEMKEGTDYTVQYFGEGSSGLLAAVVRGTGAYCGTAYVTYAQTGQLPQSGTVPVNLAQNDSAEFQFIPETGGTYRFYTDYSGDEIRAVLDKNVFDPERFDPYRYYSLKTEMQICDANGEEIASVSESPVQPAAMTAVLKAGQTYFVTVRMITMNATESFVLGVEHERCPLAETKVYFEETVYAGDAEQPAPRLWNDTEQLKEGIDYTVAAPESAEPGYRMFLISGCGKYCGHCYCFSEVLDGFSKPQKLELNAPFTQKYAEVTYTFALDQPVTLRLRPDDGAKENYTAQLTRKLEPTVRNLDMNRQTVDLVPDSYTLTLWQQSGAERTYVLETMRRQTDISACEIVTQNAVCTGQPVTPDVKVSDNGVLLTEGSDYFVSCQQTLQETGQYILHITGNGRYCGTASVSMCILPADLTALPLLTDGEYTAKIEKPAQTVLYRWSPGTNGCISTDANMDKQFSVSQNGTVLAQTGGIGFDMLTPDTEADAVYVVAVSLRNPDETGTVRFTVQSGFRELSLCHADIPAQLPADSAGGLPAFTVKDGDTVLKEGTDYTVYASGGQDRCGRAQIILRGTGKYTGELVLEYLRYPEDPEKFALAENADDGEYEIEQLVTEEPVRLIYSLPGTVSLFRFRAADDGTYYFMLPEQNASAFVYLPDGSVLPAGQNAAALSAGDECLILTVSDWVEPGFNRYDTFEVGVSRTAPVGDVNGDGRTDTDDALALLRWLSESEGAALQNPDAADCNADGFIDMLDVQTILRISKES